MAAVLKHWRESATLILVTSKVSQGVQVNLGRAAVGQKPPPSSDSGVSLSGGPGTNFDVLMMKRSGKSKFMPDLHVFPGGVADNSDFSSRWLTVFKKLGSETQKALFSHVSQRCEEASSMITRHRDPEFRALPADVAFRICAIRETFEEAGVLLARPASASHDLVKQLCATKDEESSAPLTLDTGFIHEDPQVIKTWRDRVNREPSQFLEMCLQLDLVPEIWCLHEWANWLTPVHGKQNNRRFDTVFYVCCVDHKPQVEQDFGETVKAMWAPPRQLLSAYFREKGGLGFPQIYELARLLNFSSAEDLLQLLSSPGRDRTERWFPVLAHCTDFYVSLMPGDELYPKEPDFINQKIIEFPMSLEELNRTYPAQHRNCYSLQDLIFLPNYAIQPRHGHVGPDQNGTYTIFLQSKL
ncbi:Nudix (Nucleoside diphosphate linked moiety X)-type motif 19 [Elysia marginata]|uniref:Nudix (Nucleoside diphosphate linked moiety X)-type motif 19 n=1 Tax=Elysia marginata TaxID=1093978 RepID=A0AAV4F4U4_9GAST|nr:Nudix (Nucleoside diphosphate linked moiety X)-type motif 19 [Elysia marginata]